jgi:FtsH-binding integral membrane protein
MTDSSTYTSTPVEMLGIDARAAFITRTYTHLFGAIIGFVLVEMVFFTTGLAEVMARAMLGTSWLLVLGGFVLVSWLASRAAHQSRSLGTQYLALGGFVMAEAVIFVPLLFIAQGYAQGGVIESAATVTLLGFGALTAIAFWTRRDFSFLGALLRWVGIVALVAIVAAVLFGFELGTWFSVAMIGVAGAAILYDTSNVIHHFPEDRYVAAALTLFASVALMFWYVLRLFMGSRD